jgi:hypothetical protein
MQNLRFQSQEPTAPLLHLPTDVVQTNASVGVVSGIACVLSQVLAKRFENSTQSAYDEV